ncbi:MAG: BrnA antitoxin family protein [Novosphingobium sp.]
MTKPGYSQDDIDAVSDNPEWTREDFAKARPFTEALPKMAETIRRRGPQKAATKVSTTIRLSPEVIAHFRAGGPGWQSRIDEALKEWVAMHGDVA